MESSTKKIEKSLFKAAIVLLVLAVVVMIASINSCIKFSPTGGEEVRSGLSYGYCTGLWIYKNYFAVALVGDYGTRYWANTCNMGGIVTVSFTLVSIVLMVVFAIILGKNKQKWVGNIVVGALVTLLAGYAYAMASFGVLHECMTDRARVVLSAIVALSVASTAVNAVAMVMKLLDVAVPAIAKSEGFVNKDEPVEEKKEEPAPAEEEPVEEEPAEEPAPAEEEPAPAEEPVEEPAEEPAPAEAPAGPAYGTGKRRHAKFETKVKGSEEDLRHKYYDLRDYIRSYGVSDRISVPGHTFSAHRERLAFIAISGKHLKVAFALDPKDYEGGTIPVGTNESKKFEDLKVSFKVRSDLSFRRACKLVDDVMAAKGIEKPEGK